MNAGEIIERIKMAVLAHGAQPNTRIIVREGAFGPERQIEHIKARHSKYGIELIIETAVKPNDG